MICLVCEKASAAKNFEKALGGKTGIYNGENYMITNLSGHVMSFPNDPDKLVPGEKKEKYKSWALHNLPWDAADFNWRKIVVKDKKKTYDAVKNACSKADEIVIATDDDPSGEGTLLAAEVLLSYKLKNKKYSRMFFVDESAKSIQEAFKKRVPIPVLKEERDYIKADYRSKWDYLSMQFTRIATKCGDGYSVLRNGRLKSFMVSLIGDGLKALAEYKKIPYFQNAFQDENGVWYMKKGNHTYAKKEDVPLDGLHDSPVVALKPVRKKQAPPKLIDLAGIASKLAARGIKAKDVLNTYQKMYEDSVVSYPRTEDKTITTEQFNELKANMKQIADLVGVPKTLLTHTIPRKTHVKDVEGHGANRPGSNIPNSLSELKKYGKGAESIYKILAYSTLAMFCEDYEYDIHEGYVKDFKDYKGKANVPVKLGFKEILGSEDDSEMSRFGLGQTATPKVREKFPPKPPTPTMKWLMKQLEKYNVGTGATRTSVYAEVTNEKYKFRLVNDAKGKLTLTKYGDMNYALLKNTNIGSAKLTENLQKTMKDIGDGKLNDIDSLLAEVANIVVEDMKIMKENSKDMPTFEKKEKVTGNWKGEEVSFNAVWSGHRFTPDEISDLLNGNYITFKATSKAGKQYDAYGKLAKQTYNGNDFVGFKLELDKAPKHVPSKWAGHVFTEEEKKRLENGESIDVDNLVSKAGSTYNATMTYTPDADYPITMAFRD